MLKGTDSILKMITEKRQKREIVSHITELEGLDHEKNKCLSKPKKVIEKDC